MSLSEEISIKFEGGVFLQYYKLSPNSGEICKEALCHLAKFFLGGKFTSVEFANQILRISFTIKIKTHVMLYPNQKRRRTKAIKCAKFHYDYQKM